MKEGYKISDSWKLILSTSDRCLSGIPTTRPFSPCTVLKLQLGSIKSRSQLRPCQKLCWKLLFALIWKGATLKKESNYKKIPECDRQKDRHESWPPFLLWWSWLFCSFVRCLLLFSQCVVKNANHTKALSAMVAYVTSRLDQLRLNLWPRFEPGVVTAIDLPPLGTGGKKKVTLTPSLIYLWKAFCKAVPLPLPPHSAS